MVSSRIEAPFVAFEAAVADKRMDEYSLRHEELVKQTVGAETFGYKTARDAVHFLLYSDAWRQAFAAAVSLSNDATLDHIEMAHDYQDQVTFAQEQLAQRNPYIFAAFSTLEQYRTPNRSLNPFEQMRTYGGMVLQAANEVALSDIDEDIDGITQGYLVGRLGSPFRDFTMERDMSALPSTYYALYANRRTSETTVTQIGYYVQADVSELRTSLEIRGEPLQQLNGVQAFEVAHHLPLDPHEVWQQALNLQSRLTLRI